MLMICIFLLLITDTFFVQETARPLAVQTAGSGHYWLTHREDGQLPLLRFAGGSFAPKVTLPHGTLFVSAVEDGLLVVSAQEVALYTMGKDPVTLTDQLTLVETRHQLTQPLQRRHPWTWLTPLALSPRVLAIFDGSRLLLIPVERAGKPLSIALPEKVAESYLVTNVLTHHNSLFWSTPKGGYSLDIMDPTLTVNSLSQPATRNMELASLVALPKQEPMWFLYGGQRGALDSFGWKLGAKSGSGGGIVTRFGVDQGSVRPNFFVFTIPSSLGSQAWQALMGQTSYTCQQLLGDSWKLQKPLTIKMVKSNRDKAPYLITWASDLNGDGYADLLLADDKSGVRVYLSKSDGALASKWVFLAKNPDVLLTLPHALVLGQQTEKGWNMETRSTL